MPNYIYMEAHQKSKVEFLILQIELIEAQTKQKRFVKHKQFLMNSIYQWILKYKIYIKVQPLDRWDNWVWEIWEEDIMSPFYTSVNFDEEFPSYADAMLDAMQSVLYGISYDTLSKTFSAGNDFELELLKLVPEMIEKCNKSGSDGFFITLIDNKISYFSEHPRNRLFFKFSKKELIDIQNGKF